MSTPARHVAAVRSLGPWAVALVVLAGLCASVLAASLSGAVAPPPGGLSDAGPVVRWALPPIRLVHDVAAALTVGTLVLAATMVPGATRQASAALEEPRRAAALRIATASAFVWAIAGVVVVIFTFADASGLALGDPLFASKLLGSVWAIDTFRIGLISAMAAFVVASGAAVARARSVAVALSVVALFGIAVLGLAGHAGGSSDHETAVNAMGVHLLSATLWTGGLLALIVLRPQLGTALSVVVRRYSTVALWAFIALGTSGVLAATTRFDRIADLTTSYGIIVMLKAAALVLLGFAGWWHRRVTVDALERRGADGSGQGRPFLRLAVGEVIVMGLAFGLATALARTEPPVPETLPNPSPALALTDFPEPPAPTALSWVTAWRVDWLFLAVALLAIGLYLAGVVRMARRGDRWPVLRTVNWILGWLVLVWATSGVLGIYGRVAFSWHMTLHMIEAMVVPILLVLGAPVTLALRALRKRADGTLGPRELLLGVVHSPYLKVVGNPIFAAAFFFMSLVVFYWTGLFELALTTHTGHLVMTVHFLMAGYLFAWVLVGIDPGPPKWSPALRLIVLFATIAFHAFFGVSMISGTALLAPDFFTTINVSWIDDPLADQRNGGAIAWAIGELPALVLALLVATQWARADKREGRRRDRRADRDGDAELAAYNEQLARLAERDRTNQP